MRAQHTRSHVRGASCEHAESVKHAHVEHAAARASTLSCCADCRHPDLEESLLRYFGDHATPAHLKMADTPGDDTTRLLHYALESGTPSPFPVVAVRNVFVLPGARHGMAVVLVALSRRPAPSPARAGAGRASHPTVRACIVCPRVCVAGVPHLLQQKWPAVAAELQAAVQLAPFSNRVVRLASEDEAAVAPLLDTLAAEWGGEIAIGSYPVRQGRWCMPADCLLTVRACACVRVRALRARVRCERACVHGATQTDAWACPDAAMPQVSGQRDGARLLVTLESKQAERLDSATERLQGMLPRSALLGVQSDVSSLSGQSGLCGTRRNSLGSMQAAGLATPTGCRSPAPAAAARPLD